MPVPRRRLRSFGMHGLAEHECGRGGEEGSPFYWRETDESCHFREFLRACCRGDGMPQIGVLLGLASAECMRDERQPDAHGNAEDPVPWPEKLKDDEFAGWLEHPGALCERLGLVGKVAEPECAHDEVERLVANEAEILRIANRKVHGCVKVFRLRLGNVYHLRGQVDSCHFHSRKALEQFNGEVAGAAREVKGVQFTELRLRVRQFDGIKRLAPPSAVE